jgi:hypothetical protein
MNCSNEIFEELNHLNYFLNQEIKYYKKIFYYLHKLSITCSLCMEYSRLCTNFELANRFVYIRMDLLDDLKNLNEEIKSLLIRINRNFQEKKRVLIRNKKYHYSNENIQITKLVRTIFLWFIILFLIGWPIVYENKPKNGWSV